MYSDWQLLVRLSNDFHFTFLLGTWKGWDGMGIPKSAVGTVLSGLLSEKGVCVQNCKPSPLLFRGKPELGQARIKALGALHLLAR